MGLNIKNERVHQLARELAALKGESMTRVIEHALENEMRRIQVERVKDEARREAAYAELMRIIEDGPRLRAQVTSDTNDMYDEDGLPAW